MTAEDAQTAVNGMLAGWSLGNTLDAWMARVREVVGWALDEGLYVILNIHHDTGDKNNDPGVWLRASKSSWDTCQERYKKIWQQIATTFGGASFSLIQYAPPAETTLNET